MQWSLRRVASLSEAGADIDRMNDACGGNPLLSSRFLIPIIDGAEQPPQRMLLAGLAAAGETAPRILTVLAPGRWPCVWETCIRPQAPLGLLWVRPGTDGIAAMPALLRALPGAAQLLALIGQDIARLQARSGPCMTVTPHLTSGAIAVDGDFETYWNDRPAKYRRNISNRYNRLQRDGKETRLEVLRAPEDMARAVDEFGIMESAGWKGRADTAVHPDNIQGEIYRTIMRSFAETGEALAFRYFIGDELASTDLALKSAGQLIFLKTTYAEAFSSYAPSQLMRREIFEMVFREKLANRIEFFGRVQDRHRALCTHFWDVGHINIYRWPVLKALHQRLR